jgi:hypothetical protein
LQKNLENAVRENARAEEDFELLNEAASLNQRTAWQLQLDKAHAQRSENVKAMDVLNIKIEKRASHTYPYAAYTYRYIKSPLSSQSSAYVDGGRAEVEY